MEGIAGTSTIMMDSPSTPQLQSSSAAAAPSPRKAFLTQRGNHFRKMKSVPAAMANKSERSMSLAVSNGNSLLQSPSGEFLDRRVR